MANVSAAVNEISGVADTATRIFRALSGLLIALLVLVAAIKAAGFAIPVPTPTGISLAYLAGAYWLIK
jgi:hypothetical protein